MSNYEEIKKLLKASKSMLSNEKTITENKSNNENYEYMSENKRNANDCQGFLKHLLIKLFYKSSLFG